MNHTISQMKTLKGYDHISPKQRLKPRSVWNDISILICSTVIVGSVYMLWEISRGYVEYFIGGSVMEKSYWIKERHNPQLGIYYVPMGQMTKSEAMKGEDSLYGHNVMHRFSGNAAYLAEIQRLKDANESVHD